jgi:hypothetical protein
LYVEGRTKNVVVSVKKCEGADPRNEALRIWGKPCILFRVTTLLDGCLSPLLGKTTDMNNALRTHIGEST